MTLKGKRVLYISYNGMLDPLGQSQVIPYLRELSTLGVRFTLLSYERAFAWCARSNCPSAQSSHLSHRRRAERSETFNGDPNYRYP
jgi:hypothetical protein